MLESLGEGYYLVRNNSRGDEFSIYGKGTDPAKAETLFDTVAEAVNTRVFTLDNESLEPLPRRGEIIEKETPDAKPAQKNDARAGDEVRGYLTKTHPEILDGLASDSMLLSLVRDLVIDPVLSKEKPTLASGIKLFYDAEDYNSSLMRKNASSNAGQHVVFRYETTGNKFINDTTHDYEEGNENVRQGFVHLVRQLQKLGVDDLGRISMRRMGGDYLFDIVLTADMPSREVLQDELQSATTYFESNKLPYRVPLLPAVSSAIVDFKNSYLDKVPVPPGTAMSDALRSKLQLEAFTRRNQAFRDHYRQGARLERGDWEYLAYQFNPRSKRGAFYALEYGMKTDDYRKLEKLYEVDRVTGSYHLPQERMGEFQELILRNNMVA